MNDILADMNQAPGIKGSAVVTIDGITVASRLSPDQGEDVVAGLVSFLIATVRRSLKVAEMGDFGRFVMTSTHGKVVLNMLGGACLVVITDQFAKLDLCIREIQDAALRLRKMARMSPS